MGAFVAPAATGDGMAITVEEVRRYSAKRRRKGIAEGEIRRMDVLSLKLSIDQNEAIRQHAEDQILAAEIELAAMGEDQPDE